MKARRIVGLGAAAIAIALVAAGLVAYFTSSNACDEPAAIRGDRMKAIVHCTYGPPGVLRYEDVEKPVPADDQIVVKVRAASVNPLDWHYMRGTPYVGRMEMGLRKPKNVRLGVDFAGTVESVGRNVTRFKPGDAVFGGRTGSLAEYVAVRADRAVVPMPPRVTFEQAAAVPVAALTALQALRDQGRLRPGQKVLVNGASGGVGTFAVQLAKALGAEVTGVCSTRNVELVRSIGADHVIDYTREDFTKREERYDLVLDNVGNHSLSACRRVLKPGGRYVMIGAPSRGWIDPLPRVAGAWVLSRFVSEDLLFFVSNLNPQDLTTVAELMEAGKVTPVIDRRYALSDAAAAIAYLEEGHARGKVIISLDRP